MASGYSDLSEIKKNNSQFYGLHQKPPKINLLDGKSRRESAIEQQLTSRIERTSFAPQPSCEQQQVHRVTEQQQRASNVSDNNYPMQGSQQMVENEPFNVTTTHASYQSAPGGSIRIETTRTTRNTRANDPLVAYSEIVSDLAQKEAKLRRELAYVNQHLANPWARPPKVREPRREPEAPVLRGQQRWVKELPPGSPSSRPSSRASSTRSTIEADLMEKTHQLLMDVKELEKKPMKAQQILIEPGATSSNRQQAGASGDSIQTAVIKVPVIEPDNKSPLPFAYDNFSTQGVHGNIASFGAAEPETPYPPIFPIVKRTPSPRH